MQVTTSRRVKKLHTTFEPCNARDWNIVLGGDLNMRPSDPNLNSIYEPSYGGGAYGMYREAHPDRTTKAGTTNGGARIDYIFVNNQPISISTPTITDVEYSDHLMSRVGRSTHAFFSSRRGSGIRAGVSGQCARIMTWLRWT